MTAVKNVAHIWLDANQQYSSASCHFPTRGLLCSVLGIAARSL